nr:TIGR02301 family protein [Parvularcula dongshanensis]
MFGLVPAPAGGRVPEAEEAFAARQADLVSLAGSLGTLHRLRQLCDEGEDPDLFRTRLMALIPLEVPVAATRAEMIAAFNAAYREASQEHAICGPEAEALYAEEGERALAVTERLYAPFR